MELSSWTKCAEMPVCLFHVKIGNFQRTHQSFKELHTPGTKVKLSIPSNINKLQKMSKSFHKVLYFLFGISCCGISQLD